MGFSYSCFKNSIVRVFALLLLLLFLPIMLLTALALALSIKGSPLFTQVRPGRFGVPFTIYKFKTMRDTRDNNGTLLPDHQRITRLGSLIRKLSLDELPQLVNIVKGEMTLIGPRPLLMEYLPLYSQAQMRRHDVLPGITGWAQVNGRNALSWQEKFEFDLYYIRHQSFALDIKIIALTIKNVLRAKDVNATQTVTMEPFDGTN